MLPSYFQLMKPNQIQQYDFKDQDSCIKAINVVAPDIVYEISAAQLNRETVGSCSMIQTPVAASSLTGAAGDSIPLFPAFIVVSDI